MTFHTATLFVQSLLTGPHHAMKALHFLFGTLYSLTDQTGKKVAQVPSEPGHGNDSKAASLPHLAQIACTGARSAISCSLLLEAG